MKHPVLVEGFEEFDADGGSTLLEACEAAGVPMECACGGFAACNSCRVTLLGGAGLLESVSVEEACFLDAEDQRLGCQITVQGPLRCRLDPGM